MKRTLGIDPGQHSVGISVFEIDGTCSYLAQIEDANSKVSVEEKFLAIREVVCRLLPQISQVSSEIARFGQNEPKLYGLMWLLRVEFLRRKIRYVYFAPNQWYSIAYKGSEFEVLEKKRELATLSKEKIEELQARWKAWEKRTGKIETTRLAAHELGIDSKNVGTDACDAYFIGKAGQRFWAHIDGELKLEDLTEDERRQFHWIHKFSRGPKVGKIEEGGIVLEKGHSWFPADYVSSVNIRLNSSIDKLGISSLFGGKLAT